MARRERSEPPAIRGAGGRIPRGRKAADGTTADGVVPAAVAAVVRDLSGSRVEVAAKIRDGLRARIGAERHAVWFGDGVEIIVEGPGDEPAAAPEVRVVVSAGSGFSHDWLKRAFREDVEAVVAEVCGRSTVAWRKAPPAAKPREAATARPQAATPRSVEPAPHAAPEAPRRPAAGLDSFVGGTSNRMAVAAVELSAARPGEMSPLVIHGPSGVGKSHLLEGICGLFRELHPGAVTLLLSAEQFTTSFLQALHGGGLPGFRRSCRTADLLVIDDLQFFVGKRATATELQQTVDSLHRLGRQMVFAADRDLESLDGLGVELVARLRGGISARIDPPDYDVRRGIVAAVAARRRLVMPDAVVHFIATHMTRHARELVGAVNRLEATSHMLGLPITADMAEEALSDLVRSSARSVRLADIERAVCATFGIEAGSLQSARRARTVNHPRMLAMFLARRHTSSALAEIGSYFGRRSHSTVIAAQKTVGEWVAQGSRIVLADASWDVDEAIRRVEDALRAG